jgi:thiamine-phosphate pyrophosphorylase
MDTACLRLYLATDPALTAGRDLRDLVALAIASGVTLVQVRDKRADGRGLYETACRLRDITRPHGVPLIVNDRLDVMLAAGADGVHVGPADLPLERVRALAGRALVGYSVTCPEDLAVAVRYGADYLGIGPVYATTTKPDAARALGLSGLRALVAATDLPCVAIGGITPANCAEVMAAGVDGVCVISAILGQPDVAAATQAFGRALRTLAPRDPSQP